MFVAEPQSAPPADYEDARGQQYNRYSYDSFSQPAMNPLKAAAGSQDRITRSEPRELTTGFAALPHDSNSSGLSRQNTSMSSNTNSLGSDRPVSAASEKRQEIPSPPLRQTSPPNMYSEGFKKSKANGLGQAPGLYHEQQQQQYYHEQHLQYLQMTKDVAFMSGSMSYQQQQQVHSNACVSAKVLKAPSNGVSATTTTITTTNTNHSPSNGTTVSSDGGAYNRSDDDEYSAKEVVDDETSFETDDHYDGGLVVNQSPSDQRSHTLPCKLTT